MIKHLAIKITGLVQGVGFRYFAAKKAEELGLRGFIKNEPDGSVYAEVEGQEDLVNEFWQWSHQGPPGAVIEKITAQEGKVKNFKKFEIIS